MTKKTNAARDPVHYETSPTEWEQAEDEPVWRGPGWYFWEFDEVDRCGPFETEAECRLAFEQYVASI
jgi:hypothetical protein